MRQVKLFTILLSCIILFSCNDQTPPEPEKGEKQPPGTAKNGELISIEKAKKMIEHYYTSGRIESDPEPTIAVHYTKEDFDMLFNQKTFISWKAFNGIAYDGVRIYFGRYDSTTAPSRVDVEKNTLVLILTKKNSNGYYDDIIKDIKEVPVLPLNDGSRCKPNCSGLLLYNPTTQNQSQGK